MISTSPRAEGLHRARLGRGRAIDEIEPGHGKVGRRHLGLFDDPAHGAVRVEIDHAVAFGIGHLIAEDRGARWLRIGGGHQFRQPVAEEDVVAQHQRRRGARQKILRQNEGLRQPVGRGLHDIGEADPPLRPVAQHALELVLILGRGDHRDLADARQHQHRQRIVDHRLVVDRQKLLGDPQRDRVEPRARARLPE